MNSFVCLFLNNRLFDCNLPHTAWHLLLVDWWQFFLAQYFICNWKCRSIFFLIVHIFAILIQHVLLSKSTRIPILQHGSQFTNFEVYPQNVDPNVIQMTLFRRSLSLAVHWLLGQGLKKGTRLSNKITVCRSVQLNNWTPCQDTSKSIKPLRDPNPDLQDEDDLDL